MKDELFFQKVSSITSNFHIIPFKNSSIQNFVYLFNKTYSRKINKAYILWRIFDPAAHTYFFEARYKEKFCGVFGIQINRIYNKKYKKVGLLLDWIVSKEYQYSGLIFKMLEYIDKFAIRKKLDFIYLFPNEKFCKILKKINDWNFVLDIYSCIRKTSHTDKKRQSNDNVSEITASTLVSSYIGKIQTQLKKYPEKIIKKDMKWRYVESPWYEYRFIECKYGLGIYKIFVEHQTGFKFADVVDYYPVSHSVNVLYPFFETITDYLDSLDIDFIYAWSESNSQLLTILKKLGFKKDGKRSLLSKNISINPQLYSKKNNWWIVPADSEMF